MQGDWNPVKVGCKSEFRYAQRPVSVCWQEKVWLVVQILNEAAIPEGWMFTVQLETGQVIQLKYLASEEFWLGKEQ